MWLRRASLDDVKCIVATPICVSVSVLTAFPHYCMDPDITRGMVEGPSRCALMGGFAIGAQVSLLWQHSAEHEMSASACTRSMPANMWYGDSVGNHWAGMGTRRQWPRPRRLASPAETRPRRDVQISRRDRDETFAGLETWPRRWSARLLSLMQYST